MERRDGEPRTHEVHEPNRPRIGAVRPRLTEVAALSGVSYQTVSRVLNQQPNVRTETRERVLAAMQSLGYAPNFAARALASGRSRTLGVVCYDTTLYGPAAALIGFERAAREAGHSVNIVSVETLSDATIVDAVFRLSHQGVSGIGIISPTISLGDAFGKMPAHLPVVSLWGPPTGSKRRIVVNEEQGARLATKHLLDLGHATVHIVVGPAGRIGPDARMRGWRKALAERGIAAPPIQQGDWTAQSGHAAGQLLARDKSVTAIFATSDQMALGLLAALNACGRRVPHDVSVVGFDDLPEAEFYIPPLTTVRQDFHEIGRRAAEILLQAEGAETHPTGPIVVPVTFVERSSTAPPPRR